MGVRCGVGGGVACCIAGVAFCASKCEPHGLCKKRRALKLFDRCDGLFLRLHNDKRLASRPNLVKKAIVKIMRGIGSKEKGIQ